MGLRQGANETPVDISRLKSVSTCSMVGFLCTSYSDQGYVVSPGVMEYGKVDMKIPNMLTVARRSVLSEFAALKMH